MSLKLAFARGLAAFAQSLEIGAAAARAYPEPDSGKDMPDFAAWLMGQALALPPVVLDSPNVLRKVGIMRACVMRRANDLAMVPVVFEQKRGSEWEPIERRTGNVADTWNSANPAVTAYELVRDYAADYIGTGNGFLLAEWNGRKSGPPSELWVLKAVRVQVIEGRRRLPVAYVFDRGTRERVDADKVVHLRGWSPEDEPLGTGAAESVEHAYTARYDMVRVIGALMKSGGLPSGFLRPDPPSGGVPVPLKEGEVEELERRLNSTFGGASDWFRRRVLRGPMKWERASLTPAELELLAIGDRLDRDVCSAFGVPPSMVGVGTTSGGTLGAAMQVSQAERENYLDFTLLPDARLIESVLTEKLCPWWGTNIRARFDFSEHPTMLDRQLRNGDALQKLTGGAILVVNEARKKLREVQLEDPAANELRQAPTPFGAGPTEPTPAEAPKSEAKPAPVSQRLTRVRVTLADKAKRHAVRLSQYEREFAREWRGIFSGQEKRVIEAVTHAFKFAAHGDVNAALDVDLEDRDAVQALYERLVLARGLEAAAQVAVDLDIDIHAAAASQFVKASMDAVLTQTSATTREALRTSLADGIENSETMSDLVARVRDVFDNRRSNALTIARTETVRSYNWAATWAWEQAPEVTHVQWVTAGDDAVRETHAAANGQIRRLGDSFEVGSASLAYPGDLNGEPGETINCRCVLDPLTADEVPAEEAAAFSRYWTGTNGHANGVVPKNRIRALLEAEHADH